LFASQNAKEVVSYTLAKKKKMERNNSRATQKNKKIRDTLQQSSHKWKKKPEKKNACTSDRKPEFMMMMKVKMGKIKSTGRLQPHNYSFISHAVSAGW
jgi:hypothetical protein